VHAGDLADGEQQGQGDEEGPGRAGGRAGEL
jgi:hypothetical protein